MSPESGNKKLEAGTPHFYAIRRRVYGGLLLFVIVAGVPMFSVPAFRNRLFTRVHALKVAFTGETQPVMVQTNENPGPFPAEYERPAPPPVAQVFKQPPVTIVAAAPQKKETPERVRPRRTLKIPSVDSAVPSTDENAEPRRPSPAAAESENQPKYQQGTIEKEVYDLLLSSNPAIAGLVQGSNPSLKFLSWDVAGRGEDIYWVRLKFRADGKPEVEYIWQVQLQSKKTSPLNYNARTLQQ
ncbi:MAG TPA: hypothetical protein VMG30_16020 [Acidobacteriota bacterium]|nr:hypothetical protein [Acidobacteriota bacterium]